MRPVSMGGPRGPRTRRERPRLLALLAVVIAAGLLSRRFPLPGIFAEYTGDALYAVAAYVGLAVLAPGAPAIGLAAGAAAWCTAVEFSQLATPPWLVAARATRLGGLVLGHGFQVADLIAYALGVAAASLGDRALFPANGAGEARDEPVPPSV